ncbi:alpha-D-ribose 1-methylphosphonate 5-triphosphate synthase subunit PhnH [Variovorax paradoxus]|uniref:Alpha-D-ribose 1-methylphosphonate 5-triphosphate synthase subunit PhnH n=1 Tax=Variovorax paradoxus TaxID=34073 RepID=A0AAE4BZB2_VARPD|nr:phosphonate C-P lyase system protein PhnH [Variovorax paradoxus]MDP9965357.1 alpha-D-ribose 1-methylphosphonate 5-triphosphate synthase subunit PhnH [Variovorax paradoxus]MDR6429976.1 alpha-D-ribose 1-methylphosphonate 5-triphosphate synthase subunit PhnH [Variovorax paradoxus]MDR6456488.1 alpha-D-ribose 1-methylphosphonate 5-triphosphate synthase subunit PhnH [Variovorax paradoxus]
MNANMLSTLGAGFTDAALGSQAVFRSALQALAHPGRIVELSHDAQAPSQGQGASAALLLALLDPDCRLWLSPSLAGSDAAAWLRFHTGCVLVEAPAQAQFAWIGKGDACPPLDAFAQGSDAYPDQSATCVIDVADVSAPAEGSAARWTLRGPGIQDRTALAVEGLAPAFAAQWSANHALFPRGVDVFLAAPQRIAGLPRTTRIEQEA